MGNICAAELDDRFVSKKNIIAEAGEPKARQSDESFHVQQRGCSPKCGHLFSFLLPAQESESDTANQFRLSGRQLLKLYLEEEAQEVQFS